jgi:hypothetical protein
MVSLTGVMVASNLAGNPICVLVVSWFGKKKERLNAENWLL